MPSCRFLSRCAAALLALAGAAAPALAERVDTALAVRQIVERSNEFRRGQGLAATAPSAPLTRAAQRFADFMARADRYGHRADGREPHQRARAAGYDDCIVAENIGWRFRSRGYATDELAAGFVDGWRRSPEHRANLLDGDVTETGVALARSAKTGRWYAVQLLGRPQSQRIAFALANRAPRALAYQVDGERFELPPNVTRRHALCRPGRLTLRLPGQPRATTTTPRHGERFELVAGAQGLALRRSGG